jgi:protein-disulfide isomerase
MRRFLPACLLALLLMLSALAARAEEATFTPAQRAEIVAILRQAMRNDPSILRDAVAALQADEARGNAAAARETIARLGPALTANPNDPVAGNPQGDLTVVEFYDLHCPYCRSMVPVLDQLVRSDPKLRLVFKDIPILGPGSKLGARAVLAAERQGGYAKLQTAIMLRGGTIDEDSLRADAASAGLDWDRLHRDMTDPSVEARLRANLQLAQALGVDGTPVFVIGHKLISGAAELAELQGAVAEARSER